MEIKSLQDQINTALGNRKYGDRPDELYEPIRYFINLGGKRLRPILCLLSHNLFKNDPKEAFEAALGIELFHNFTLLHDDIMDEAPIRRGKQTVHQKWNSHIAILSGDAMFVKSYQSMAAVNPKILPKVMEAFSRTGLEVCEGQQLDMNFETLQNVSVEDYLEMIRLKTAVLLGFSLELGGIIAEQDQNTIDNLNNIGINAGLGFQLMDDLLDVFGKQEKVGKQVGGDIISNKKTFLLLKALELADEKQKTELEKWLSLQNFNDEAKVKAVRFIFEELEIEKLTTSLINSYFDRSLKLIETLDADKDKKEYLKGFLQDLMNRDH